MSKKGTLNLRQLHLVQGKGRQRQYLTWQELKNAKSSFWIWKLKITANGKKKCYCSGPYAPICGEILLDSYS